MFWTDFWVTLALFVTLAKRAKRLKNITILNMNWNKLYIFQFQLLKSLYVPYIEHNIHVSLWWRANALEMELQKMYLGSHNVVFL